MGDMGYLNAALAKKLKDLHCAYIGKVLWTNGTTAKVQPLGLIKEYGSTAAKAQAVVPDVPVACRYKIEQKTIRYMDENNTAKSQIIAVPVEIAKGDLVVCLCADRDITAALRGNNELPPAGMHSISDSIIVGIL